MTDGYGAARTTNYAVQVVADATDPVVNLEVQGDPGSIGVVSRFRVMASDDVGVASRTVEVSADGGQTWAAIELDSRGVGAWTPPGVGVYQVRVTATDAAGNTVISAREFDVIDPAATQPPVVTLTAPGNNGVVTEVTAVTGTVTDNGTLLSWKLEYRPADGRTGWQTVRSVTSGLGSSVTVNETFDPTLLPNGLYGLRLTGTDTGGNTGTDEVTVRVDGNLKLGNFNLTFVDLTIPLAGIPITVGRVCETLDANEQGDFGYGWHLEMGGYKVAVDPSTTDLPFLNGSPTFKDGTRVYVTRPDGGLDGYTFTPVPAEQFFGIVLSYYPAFTPDPGVRNALRVDQTPLTKDGSTGEYFDYDRGGYNPIEFGGTYDVVEPSGLINEIDARTGEETGVRDLNGNRLTFEENGVFSNRGRSITFQRDPRGRITAVTDPSGNSVRYEYGPTGDLVRVTDRLEQVTTIRYQAPRPHYISEVMDPRGVRSLQVTYDAITGRIQTISDPHGGQSSYTFQTTVDGRAVQTAVDATGTATEKVRDARGNVTRQIVRTAPASGGDPARYVVSMSEYDSQDRLTRQSVRSRR